MIGCGTYVIVTALSYPNADGFFQQGIDHLSCVPISESRKHHDPNCWLGCNVFQVTVYTWNRLPWDFAAIQHVAHFKQT